MKILLTTFLAIFSLNSYACRCGWDKELEEIIASSKSIFVAKVISQEVVEKNYAPGDLMTLDVKLRVTQKIKGVTKKTYHAVGYEWYPYAEDGEEVVIAGGCFHHVREGDKYLIFYRKGEPIEMWWCSQYVRESENELISEVQSILKRSNKIIQATPKSSAAD